MTTTGGYLAEVTSADEDQFLFSMFDTPESTEYGPWIGARVYKDGSVIWSNSTEQARYEHGITQTYLFVRNSEDT